MLVINDAPAARTAPQAPAKALIQRRFDKACHTYTTHNQLQQEVAAHLLSLLPQAPALANTLLDLGCGPGPNWAALSQRTHTYIGVDLSQAMLSAHAAHSRISQDKRSRLIQGDMESLPLADASIDLIYSSMAVQWAESRAQLLKELSRVLVPGASAVLSMPLQESLQPLANMRKMIDQQDQVNPQPSLHSWIDSIAQSPLLQLARSEQHRFSQYFPTLRELLQSIKGVGAGANSASPLTKASLRELTRYYESERTEAGLPLHYEVGFVHIKRL